MQRLIGRLTFSFLVLCFISVLGIAQENRIQEAKLTFIPPHTFEVRVVFTNPLAPRVPENTVVSNITVTTAPSGIPLVVKRAFQEGSLEEVFVELDPSVLPGEDGQFVICFNTLRFRNSQDPSNTITKTRVCLTGDIEDAEKTMVRLEQLFTDLGEVPKSSTEKNIFASGFVAKGEGEGSEGGGTLNLNSNDLGVPGLTAFTHLKKTTAENADPKHYDVGLNYRSTLLVHRKTLGDIRDLQREGKNDEAQSKLNNLRNAVWSSVTFDCASKFEAQALSFDVTNFIGEGIVQIKSRILPLRSLKQGQTNRSRAGFFNLYMIPLGIEIGQSLNRGDEATQMGNAEQAEGLKDVDWVARYKFGGGFSLFYSDKDGRWLFKRIELDTQFAGRYLFRNEIMFDESTAMKIATDKGFKPWVQVGLNAYLADTPNGRFGFGLSYNRGSLPPVFATTNSFLFGFIFQTADDTKKP